MRAINLLAFRYLKGRSTISILSTLAVALGVSMTIAADVISGAIINAFNQSGDALTFIIGLLDQLDSLLMMVGVGITAAAGFVIYNAFAMTVAQRGKQIGGLRSLGMTRRQVMGMVLVEALLIGLFGTVLGIILGPLLGQAAIGMIKLIVSEGLFVFAASSPSPTSILVAFTTGILITLLSVIFPAANAAKKTPLTALRPDSAADIPENPRWRGIVGGVGLVGLMAYLAIAPPGEWVEPPIDARLTGLGMVIWLVCLFLCLPPLVGLLGGWFSRLARKATGRLVADNLQRGRGRVTQTILTLGLAVMLIISMTGFMSFMVYELLYARMVVLTQMNTWALSTFDIQLGMSAYNELETMEFPPEVIDEVREEFKDRLRVAAGDILVISELSAIGSNYFSFLYDADELSSAHDIFFEFTEGDADSATEIMKAGCGVLIAPLVASKNDVGLGDTFEVTGPVGPVECTVAGIGAPLVGATMISTPFKEQFGVTVPLAINITALPGVDIEEVEADLVAFVDARPGVYLTSISDMSVLQEELIGSLPVLFNALLVLAVIAAALGVVNTTTISVAEREHELALLRAVGATRRQTTLVVVGEAFLIGLMGGVIGLVAGAGMTIILATVYGGNAWGFPDLDLWGAAWRALRPALQSGLFGVLVTPFISAASAWLPVRALIKKPVVDSLSIE